VFFDTFREASAHLPDGLVRLSGPASPAQLAAAEASGLLLPSPLKDFLASFDGADLFHETWTLGGVTSGAPRLLSSLDGSEIALNEGDLLFAEGANGDRLALDAQERVIRLPAGTDERWLAGTSLERWLLATVAHERLLYGPDGEFAPEAFEEDGAEVKPRIALRQAERAAKHDPEAADWQHERGMAQRRMGKWEDAAEAFAQAAALDPANGWSVFDQARCLLTLAEFEGAPARARAAAERFVAAARLMSADVAPRIWAWAARAFLAGDDAAGLESSRAEALRLAPDLASALQRAAEQATAEEDDDAYAETAALVRALDGTAPAPALRKRSLPMASDTPVRSPAPGPTSPAQPERVQPARAKAQPERAQAQPERAQARAVPVKPPQKAKASLSRPASRTDQRPATRPPAGAPRPVSARSPRRRPQRSQ